MNLHDYCSLIANSVAETGYDSFLPSACVSGPEEERMHVLEVELKEKGESSVALTWGASLPREGAILFLAYRNGDRVITVAEVRENQVVDKVNIRVRSASEA